MQPGRRGGAASAVPLITSWQLQLQHLQQQLTGGVAVHKDPAQVIDASVPDAGADVITLSFRGGSNQLRDMVR